MSFFSFKQLYGKYNEVASAKAWVQTPVPHKKRKKAL
jgi:hypothetical protein